MSGIGDKIDKNEYNALVNSINTYMGNSTGTPLNGYGQSINALGVSESVKITVEQYGRVITVAGQTTLALIKSLIVATVQMTAVLHVRLIDGQD